MFSGISMTLSLKHPNYEFNITSKDLASLFIIGLSLIIEATMYLFAKSSPVLKSFKAQ